MDGDADAAEHMEEDDEYVGIGEEDTEYNLEASIKQLVHRTCPPDPTGKRKFRSFTLDFKLAAVQCAATHGVGKTAKLFTVDRKRIREWIADEQRLRTLAQAERNTKKRKLHPGPCKCMCPQ